MSLSETINKQDIIDATDQCVMCGLCLPHCPTYNIAKNESESPRGRIALTRAIYEEQLNTSKNISAHLDHCLTCMNCENVCPANVDYEKIIDAGRAATHNQQNLLKRLQEYLVLFSLSNIGARKVLRACITIFHAIGLHRVLSNVRLLNLLPDLSETGHFISNKNKSTDSNRTRVAIANSCAGDLVNDPTLSAAKLLLSKLDCDVAPQDQSLCCGALHQHSGNLKTAQKLRKHFLNSLNNQKLDYVISLATGCGAQIKHYPKLEGSPFAHKLANKLIDVNEFILQQIGPIKLEFKPLAEKVFLHKPCSQSQVTEDKAVIEKLLNLIPDIEVITFDDALSCCGAGGMNTLSNEKLARQLIENKMSELKNNSATHLVSSNIGCALHFQAQMKRENIHMQVCHPITLLAQQVL